MVESIEKISFEDLCNKINWLQAVIVYKQSNFGKKYSLESRSYKVYSRSFFFQTTSEMNTLLGSSLDGSDLRVRLDLLDWDVDYCYITELKPLEKSKNNNHVKLISMDNLNRLVDQFINYQDKAFLQMVIEGVSPINDVSELNNLKESDVDFENRVLTLTDTYGQVRTLKVSEKCIDYIFRAMKQELYFRQSDGKVSQLDINSKYVLKSFLKRPNVDAEGRANLFVFKRRLKSLDGAKDLKINLKVVSRSAMLHCAYEYYMRDGCLSRSFHFNELGVKFNLTADWNQTVREWVTQEQIKDVYNVDLELVR